MTHPDHATPDHEIGDPLTFGHHQYHAGETIKVCMTVCVERVTAEGSLQVHSETGRTFLIDASEKMFMNREMPAQGEPVPGDIWADRDGNEWFYTVRGFVCGTSQSQVGNTVSYINNEYGPLRRIHKGQGYS